MNSRMWAWWVRRSNRAAVKGGRFTLRGALLHFYRLAVIREVCVTSEVQVVGCGGSWADVNEGMARGASRYGWRKVGELTHLFNSLILKTGAILRQNSLQR